jgi:energy-coupling factor transport system permease protein
LRDGKSERGGTDANLETRPSASLCEPVTLDPRTRPLAAAGLWAVVLDAPLSLGLLALAGALAMAAAPLSARARLRVAGLVLLLVGSTTWTQGLFYGGAPRTQLLSVGPVILWREGVLHGLVQSLRLVALGLLGSAVAVSTPPDRLFAGLVALRVPHGLAFLAVAGLRFVPVVMSEWWIVRQARARRGRPVWQRAPWSALAEEMALLSPVAARAVRRARTLAETMDSRGFDPLHPRRPRVPLRLGPLDLVVGLLLVALTAALLSAELLFQLYVHGLLYVPALRPLYGQIRTWL